MALSWTMDKIGPLCRSAVDCGLVLQTIAGSDSGDPGSAGKSFYYTPEYSRKMTDLVVGFAPDDIAWADAASLPALQAAMQAIAATGVRMMEVALPDLPYDALADMVIGAEGGSVFEPLVTTGQVDQLADPSQAAGIRANLGIAAKDYLRAMRIRSVLKQKFHELFATVDILVAPTRYNAAPKVSDPLDGPDPTPSGQPKTPGMRSLIGAGNLAGIPALSVPCGFAPGNLPVGLQLVGPAFTENTLLALGRAFQSTTDWHKRRPPLVS
jgi:aspartyl-tRNA(Asn)/glutamyl-tRNA(Gln) amidotransferase subunit A